MKVPDWRNPEFDWDPWEGGNSDKLIDRHDVYPAEAEQIFYNGPLVRRHRENAEKELRYFLYGQTDDGRYLFLICILRGGQVRVYSARDMADDEQQQYRVHRR